MDYGIMRLFTLENKIIMVLKDLKKMREETMKFEKMREETRGCIELEF
jgi:hypothetical protein